MERKWPSQMTLTSQNELVLVLEPWDGAAALTVCPAASNPDLVASPSAGWLLVSAASEPGKRKKPLSLWVEKQSQVRFLGFLHSLLVVV